MHFFDFIKISTRSFKARPSRTIFTILGVSVGIGAILFLVSFGTGLQQLLVERITTDEALLSLDVIPPASEIVVLDQKTVEDFKNFEHVEKVSALATFQAQLTFGDINADVVAYSADNDYLLLSGLKIIAGSLPNTKESDSVPILVSNAIISAFNVSAKDALGKVVSFVFFLPKTEGEQGKSTGVEEITIHESKQSYIITGIMDEDVIPLVYIPSSFIKEAPVASYSQVKVKVEHTKFMDSVRDSILAKGFAVSSISETIEQANKIFRSIQIVLFIFGVVSLVVAAIGLMNTMTITLLERTNEVGIMRAIGGSPKDIRNMFLAESTIIGTAGGICGIFVGIATGEVFNLGINILAAILGARSVDLFVYPLWFMVFIVFLSSFVGLLTGLWPARRAARLNPLKALRYK